MSKNTVKEKQLNTKLINALNDNFNIAIVVIVLIFLSLAYILVIKPKYDATLISIKANINQQELFYASQKQRLVDLKTVAGMYNDLAEENILKVHAILPEEYPKEKLFGQLEDLITRQGVVLDSVLLVKDTDEDQKEVAANPEKVTGLNILNSDKVGTIRVDLEISTIDYLGLKTLLPLLESHVQLLDIESIEFDSEGQIATLSILTYYFK